MGANQKFVLEAFTRQISLLTEQSILDNLAESGLEGLDFVGIEIENEPFKTNESFVTATYKADETEKADALLDALIGAFAEHNPNCLFEISNEQQNIVYTSQTA